MSNNPGDVLLDKYHIEALIGRGAFAEVYLATHLALNAPRALKILRKDAPGLDSSEYGDFKARFQLEAQLGAMIDHPNIIRVYDFEQDDETLILVMEYAPGGNLAERIAKARKTGEPIPTDEALQIGIDVASGLAELHQRDIVHRDLKPSNIVIDDKGHAKITDLGLAQISGGPSMRSQLSEPNLHPGTPGYMSPEQEHNRKYLGPNSDVYSLGLVLFELLTNRNYHNVKPGTKIVDLRKDIPRKLDDLIQKLVQDPAKRPWDGDEAIRLLRESRSKHKLVPKWLFAVISTLIALGILLGLYYQGSWLTPALNGTPQEPAEIEATSPPTITNTQLPTETFSPFTPSPIASPTRTEEPSSTATNDHNATKTLIPTSADAQIESLEEKQSIHSEIDGMELVLVESFWIDKIPITNAMFQRFVDETGYLSDAEKSGFGYVWQALVGTAEWTETEQNYDSWEWKIVAGATWQHPQGVGSNNIARDPVVQISWNDASTYCNWANRSLLSLEEWQAGTSRNEVVREKENEIVSSMNYSVSEWLVDDVDGRRNMVVWEDILVSWFSLPFSENGWPRNQSNDHLTFRCGMHEHSDGSSEISATPGMTMTPEITSTPVASPEENLYYLRITNSCDSNIMVAFTKSGQTETFYPLGSGEYRIYSQEAGSYSLDVRGSWLEKYIWDGSIQIPDIRQVNVMCSSVDIK